MLRRHYFLEPRVHLLLRCHNKSHAAGSKPAPASQPLPTPTTCFEALVTKSARKVKGSPKHFTHQAPLPNLCPQDWDILSLSRYLGVGCNCAFKAVCLWQVASSSHCVALEGWSLTCFCSCCFLRSKVFRRVILGKKSTRKLRHKAVETSIVHNFLQS